MKPGQTAVVTGANGGVGTALLELLRVQPRIAARLPLLAGREGERLLQAGGLAGKIVLLK
jgi:NADPH:quinone reductase-like Zn-dependent oxidoreductase